MAFPAKPAAAITGSLARWCSRCTWNDLPRLVQVLLGARCGSLLSQWKVPPGVCLDSDLALGSGRVA